jgi:phage shock protein C
MTNHMGRNSWTVIAGLVLVLLGVWFLLEIFFAPLMVPVAIVLGFLSRIGWPLVLIGLGVLLILRARGGGWSKPTGRLMRSRTDRMIGGVLGGFAAYLNVDSTVLRVVFAFLTLFTGIWWGVLLYIAAMILVPEDQIVAGWTGFAAANAPTPPPPAPPIPQSQAASAPTPPPAPSAPSSGSEPPQAPPVPPAPTVL